jgi:hypothetical protein
MSDFSIAHRPLKLNLNRVDLMNCSNNHESGIFFTGRTATTHASLGGEHVSLKEPFELSFEIKSRTRNGVVLFMTPSLNDSMSKVQHYALLELVDGELVYKVVLGGQESAVRYMPERARNELCNSSWIRIKLKTTERGVVSLELKGVESTNSFTSDLAKLTGGMTTSGGGGTVVYMGALPSKDLYAEVAQSGEPFVGCVRDLTVRKSRAAGVISKVLLEMSLQDDVLTYCPLK